MNEGVQIGDHLLFVTDAQTRQQAARFFADLFALEGRTCGVVNLTSTSRKTMFVSLVELC